MRFGFFPPLMFLGGIVMLVLIVFLAYWLFTRNGWRLTRQTAQVTQTTEGVPPKTENE
jgi:hypothetical protein